MNKSSPEVHMNTLMQQVSYTVQALRDRYRAAAAVTALAGELPLAPPEARLFLPISRFSEQNQSVFKRFQLSIFQEQKGSQRYRKAEIACILPSLHHSLIQ